MSLSRIVSEINGHFSQKPQIKFLPIPVYLCPLFKGVPLGIGYRRLHSKKKLKRMCYRAEKEV